MSVNIQSCKPFIGLGLECQPRTFGSVVWMLIFRGSTNLSNEEEILVGKYFGLSFGEEKWNLAKIGCWAAARILSMTPATDSSLSSQIFSLE